MDTQIQDAPAVPETELRTHPDRRKEQKLSSGGLQVQPTPLDFQDRRIEEYRRAADRHEAAGNTATARMYRNDAWLLECEQEGKPAL